MSIRSFPMSELEEASAAGKTESLGITPPGKLSSAIDSYDTTPQ